MNKEIIKKKIIKSYFVKIIFVMIFYIFRVFRIKQKKILFQNFGGNNYGDNPKYIADELIKNNEFELVWVVKNIDYSKFPNGIRLVKKYSFRYFYDMVTSKVWVNNARFEWFVRKRKHQFYIQTWHGGVGLKKVEQAAQDTLPKKYIIGAKNDSKMIDAAISNSKYRTDIYKNSFWYTGKVYEYGSPRNDIYFRKNLTDKIREKIRNYYSIDDDKKILLFAPTFRSDKKFNYLSFNIEQLLKELNYEYVLFVRMHADTKISIDINNSNVIDVSSYPDVNELMIASDMAISDYSSLIFDYIYTKKPIYLYAPDYDTYIKERGFLVDYNSLPFPICFNKSKLIESIKNNEFNLKKKDIQKFISNKRIVDDGNASRRVVSMIRKIVGD